jgi:hypothetical protein
VVEYQLKGRHDSKITSADSKKVRGVELDKREMMMRLSVMIVVQKPAETEEAGGKIGSIKRSAPGDTAPDEIAQTHWAG